MIRVFIVSPEFLPIPAVMGGAVESLLTLFIEENERNKKIKLFVVSPREGIKKNEKKKYKNTKIIYLKSRGLIHKMYEWMKCKLSYKFRLCKGFSKIYYLNAYIMSKIVHPDLILAEGLGYWDMRVFSKKYGREKMVLHLHHEKKSDINYKKVYGNVITTSEFIKKSWMKGESIDSECIHVVKNGIDFLRFQRDFNGEEKRILMEKLGIKKNDFVVMYSGRIVPVKGVKELVLAWKYLSGQDIKLLIVGGTNFADSVNSSYLEEIQKFSKNDDRILLTGYVPNDKLYQYYNIAKVLIVPSLCEEAAGLVAIEGMICGLPLIITKSGGLREYVTSNCSIQLERDKNLSQNIAKAIDKFKADRKLYENYSKNAIETAKKYSGETYWSQLQKVLSSILEEK